MTTAVCAVIDVPLCFGGYACAGITNITLPAARRPRRRETPTSLPARLWPTTRTRLSTLPVAPPGSESRKTRNSTSITNIEAHGDNPDLCMHVSYS